MARIKAIFDADILIHLLKTNAINFAIETLGIIYVSDYVYQNEIKKDTPEGKAIEKLKNSGNIKIMLYSGLTPVQKKVYKETYKLLKKEDVSENPEDNPINEGERVTASFAKACNIYYHMSDDNRASSQIRSLASVDIVNFCDILYIHLIAFNKRNKEELKKSYNSFVGLYEAGKVPRILKNQNGIRPFEEMMAIAFDRFNNNENLKRLLENVKDNIPPESLTATTELLDKDN